MQSSSHVLLQASINVTHASVDGMSTIPIVDGVSTIPIALTNSLGGNNGTVITLLLEDAGVLRTSRVLQHLLARVTDRYMPFELTDPTTGKGLEQELQVLLSRTAQGSWQLTIINNKGVAKQPSKPAVVDASAALRVAVSLKPVAQGDSIWRSAGRTTEAPMVITKATMFVPEAKEIGIAMSTDPLRQRTSLEPITVEAGDLAVLEIVIGEQQVHGSPL
jgi:hypothetical protein